MSDRSMYADPTFWAAHAALERAKRQQARQREQEEKTPNTARWIKRLRIRELTHNAMNKKKAMR